jgi:hypothetical protein
VRLFEITNENQVLIKLRGLQFDFTQQYTSFIEILDTASRIHLAHPAMFLLMKRLHSHELDDFENKLQEFINNDSFNVNDPDLINYINLAKQQLEHIKQLRQQVGI